MGIDEFKIIFYWEYSHRVLARLIGIFFLIPLIYFYLTKKINNSYLKLCYLIFSLIVFQGIIGWFMVKSGLVDDVTVSHYRLAAHLITAIIIISIIFWLIINIFHKSNIKLFNFKKKNIPFVLLILFIYFQIIMGALVSGLDAGKIYQTWPLMGESFFPNDLVQINLFRFDNHSLVQLYHRIFAYLLILYILILSIYIIMKKIQSLYIPLLILTFFLFLQALLGI